MSFRTTKTRVKARKNRSTSSTRWLQRQVNDVYVQRAKVDGYRCRSAYKLLEIDEKIGLLKKNRRVLDLGCAPGGWLQVAASAGCRITGLDLQEVEPLSGVTLIQGDFLDQQIVDQMIDGLNGRVDLVLSDMAPAATGKKVIDRLRAESIAECLLDTLPDLLCDGGDVVIKLVRGSEQPIQTRARALFKSTKLVRPPSTRKESSEIFLVGQDYKRPDRDPDDQQQSDS